MCHQVRWATSISTILCDLLCDVTASLMSLVIHCNPLEEIRVETFANLPNESHMLNLACFGLSFQLQNCSTDSQTFWMNWGQISWDRRPGFSFRAAFHAVCWAKIFKSNQWFWVPEFVGVQGKWHLLFQKCWASTCENQVLFRYLQVGTHNHYSCRIWLWFRPAQPWAGGGEGGWAMDKRQM